MKFKIFLMRLKARLCGDGVLLYLSSYDILPAPLDADSERRYIQMLDTDARQARRVLIEHNLRLVVYIARKFDTSGIMLEDLVSIGSIGLIKAVNTYRVDKNIKLATYASKCIENEILMFLRKSVRTRNEVSLDEPLNLDWDGNELLLSDVISTDGEEVASALEKESELNILGSALSSLREQDRNIIVMRFGVNGGRRMTQKEVADVMNISQSYISRLEKKIVGLLKKEMLRRIG